MLGRTLLLTALLASSAEAFWRLPCANPVVVERADPIVSPGSVAGHTHTVLGGSNFALTNTFEDMRASECTSCLVKQDMSAYWTPQLYFQWANGSFTSVTQVGGSLVYYLPRAHVTDTTGVTAFPDGLRLLTGNPFKRSYNSSSLMDKAIGWNCLGGAQPTRKPGFPTNDCPDGLRGEVFFPSCWNGKDLDSSDHFSHMAYPFDNESGPCPATHPVRLVSLFYEVMWSVHDFVDVRSQALNPEQPFVLANGDPTGYGYHGDFLNGWDRDVLQEAIDTCTSDSGVIEYCKVFDLYEDGHKCHKTPDVNEIVLGTLDKLPGCNPVTYGPQSATPCSQSPAPQIFLSPVAYTGAAPPPGSQVRANEPVVLESYNDWTYQDCYADNVGGVRALATGLSTSEKTAEACLDACAAKGFTHCGIEYYGECWGANVLDASSTALGYGSCGYACKDDPTTYCGGSDAFELYTRESTSIPSSTVSSTTTTSSASSTSAALSTTVATTTTTTSASPAATSSTNTKLLNDADWTYSGCMADNVNSARSLPQTFVLASRTIENCLAACEDADLAVCGISYGGECYGGPAISSASSDLVASRCEMTCDGDKSQTCGGSNSLDVYYSKKVKALTWPSTPNLATFGDYTYEGCYSDLVDNVRSLPDALTSNHTIEGCLVAAAKAGKKFAGLSYFGECWTADAALGSKSTKMADSVCTYPCKNNPLEWCGGSAALSLYKVEAVETSAYTHSGCYTDLVNSARSLPITLSTDGTWGDCLALCEKGDYAVCGLSYGGECYAGPSLSSASTTLSSSRCNMFCSDSSTKTCGGPSALDIYYSTSTKALTWPETPNLAKFGTWEYEGCYSDLVDNVRSLPDGLTGQSNFTVEGCLAAASKEGKKYGGLSYYGECWTGDVLGSGSEKLEESSCTFPCKNNPLEWCGGSAALSVYVTSASTSSRRGFIPKPLPSSTREKRALLAGKPRKALREKRTIPFVRA